MAITAGVLSQVVANSNDVQLLASAVTGDTGPTTYQWYYSTTTGFAPSGANDIPGATSLSLSLAGLIPNTTYFFKVVATDTGHSNDQVTYAQLAVVTSAASLSQNQFQQRAILGQVDMPYSFNTIAVQVDHSELEHVYPGSPLKVVDSVGGAPKVVLCTADTDDFFGFANYNIKNSYFTAGMPLEISQEGNWIFLYATGPIARGARVQLDLLNNGVAEAVASSGKSIVGVAMDKAVSQGDLIRVSVLATSFEKA